MPAWAWLLALAGVVLAIAVLYWLLVLTEGAYLGPRAVAALYNRVARRYDRIKQFDDEDEAYFLGRPIARFLAGLPDSPGEHPWLLDVAAGTGRLPATVLAASQGRCRIVALDRSGAMLAEAQRKLGSQGWQDVVYVVHDADPLPFADGQFAVATCLEALEFISRPEAALGELMRVTQPGGLAVLSNRIGREARLMPGRIFSRKRLSVTLRALGAAGVEVMPWQIDYDLVLAVKAGQAPTAAARDWTGLLACPRCHSRPGLVSAGQPVTVACTTCNWRLDLRSGLWQSS